VKALVLNWTSLALSLAGVFVSGVLSVGAYYRFEIPCGASHGCDRVAMDPSSHALGIPNAYLGLIAYVVLVALTLWRMSKPSARFPVMLGFALSGIGALASMVLTYYSIVVIGATCAWCLSSAIIMVVLLIVHAGLAQAGTTAPPQEFESRTANTVFATICFCTMAVALGIFWDGIVKEAKGLDIVITTSPIDRFLPKDAHMYGDPKAPITIIEFGDLLCPSCQAEYSKVHEFLALHGNEVNYVFREFPMYTLKGHEQSAPAAVAAEIAGEQGRFWQFVDAMYAQQREDVKDTEPILDVAKSIGLDPEKVLERMQDKNDPAFKRMMRDIDDGSVVGVHGTPTFFVYAKGVPGVRLCPMSTIWDDLNQAPYRKFYKRG